MYSVRVGTIFQCAFNGFRIVTTYRVEVHCIRQIIVDRALVRSAYVRTGLCVVGAGRGNGRRDWTRSVETTNQTRNVIIDSLTTAQHACGK